MNARRREFAVPAIHGPLWCDGQKFPPVATRLHDGERDFPGWFVLYSMFKFFNRNKRNWLIYKDYVKNPNFD